MVRFTPDFEMLPGTKPATAPAPAAKKDPFAMDAPGDTPRR
jgi:hypothetical protein